MEKYKESILKMLSKVLTKDIIYDNNTSLDISGRRIFISSATILPLSVVCNDGEILLLEELCPEDVIKIAKLLCIGTI